MDIDTDAYLDGEAERAFGSSAVACDRCGGPADDPYLLPRNARRRDDRVLCDRCEEREEDEQENDE